MSLNFPSSPATNDLYTLGSRTWRFNGFGWAVVPPQGELGYTGSRGVVGFTGSQGIPGGFAGVGFTGSAGTGGGVGFTGSQGAVGFTGSGGATALSALTDVNVSSAVAGQVLGYTGSNWVPTVGGGGGGDGADSYVKTYFWEGVLQENVSTKRYYIHVVSTMESISINLGSTGQTQSTIQIKKNNTTLNTIVIPANTSYILTNVSHQLAVNDYITVDITQSSSAANLYVTFVYRE
jgi:hypothetical protein